MAGIGVFGGTFDPIHVGHLRSAWEVTHALVLDQLYFVPNAQTVHREQPMTSFEDRLAMIRLAIADMPQWCASACEGERSGASYSYDTMCYFRQQIGDDVPLWLIVGSDAYRQFHTWHRWNDILEVCHLAVMTRAGEAVVGGCKETQSRLLTDNVYAKVGRVIPIAVTALDVASSQIRSLLYAHQQPYFLLSKVVLDYINERELYDHSRST